MGALEASRDHLETLQDRAARLERLSVQLLNDREELYRRFVWPPDPSIQAQLRFVLRSKDDVDRELSRVYGLIDLWSWADVDARRVHEGLGRAVRKRRFRREVRRRWATRPLPPLLTPGQDEWLDDDHD